MKQKNAARMSAATASTPRWTIGLVVVCTTLIAISQIALKLAIQESSVNGATTLALLIIHPFLWLSILLNALAGVLLLIALKKGELSVLYPIIALGFVWVALAGIYFFDEHLSAINSIGLTIIILGVALIGYSGTASGTRNNTNNSMDARAKKNKRKSKKQKQTKKIGGARA